MSVIILLIALILALAAGYFFWQWKCLSKKEKLQQLIENSELGEEFTGIELENIAPQEIKEVKNKLAEKIKEAKELQKKKSDELNEEEQKAVDSLPVLQEVQSLVEEVTKPEDLQKKVYSYWDYGWAVGVFVVVLLVVYYGVGKMKSVIKSE